MTPWRAGAKAAAQFYASPFNPLSYTLAGRSMVAGAALFERMTRRYGKPDWNISHKTGAGETLPVHTKTLRQSPWMTLTGFERPDDAPAPKVLLVAPLSGHYATLLRGTVEGFLPDHDVAVTEWHDARTVPLGVGDFGLHDYIDEVRATLRFMGPQTHVIAVCQPGPAVLAAAALMAEDDDPCTPQSLCIMGSPIDARRSPTIPNKLAQEHPLSWFENTVISTVPFPHAGAMRRVYPGFVQLASFVQMNKDRHADAHKAFFNHLVAGDGDSADRHRAFYDEYLSVMDLTETFYLETLHEVFQEHHLARGIMRHHGRRVDVSALRDMALMTVEGENDDISGIGQTQAAHDLCVNIPAAMRVDYVQPDVGHYGVFSGARFRRDIQPRIASFIRQHDGRR